MKRIVLGLGLALLAVVVVGASVALIRPDLLPAWARTSPETAVVSASGSSADAGLYCAEHGVPEKFCTTCHPELASQLLLCPEHGNIPEDICTKCHPEVEEKYNIEMCPNGHGLPKHFCVECGTVTSASAEVPDDGWCATHNAPEVQCAECLANPESHDADAVGEGCRQPLPMVRLATGSLAGEIGLETALALAETHAHTIETNAETAFDANHYADVSPRVAGFLREVNADLGQFVRAGEVLAIVDSPAVSAAKSRYLSAQSAFTLAQVSYDRTKSLAAQAAVPAKQELEALTALNQAESALLESSQTLRNLGLTEVELEQVVARRETSSLLRVIAPIDGTVVKRHAVRGEAVQETTLLFAVADTSRMWLWVDVYEADMSRLALGQPVSFLVSGGTGPAFEGTVTWVGAEVDATTRTTKVRSELVNPDGLLRANQYGQAMIRVGEPHEVVVVPKAAVQRKDDTEVVFLPQGKSGVYRPQRIVAKASNRRDVVEVAWGLKPGDRVVTEGSFWLKTEIMKGAIGAGCCE